MFGPNTEIGRNENWIFYRNDWTSSATKYAKEKWKIENLGVALVEEIVLAADVCAELFDTEKYTPERAYLLIDTDTNEAIKDFTSYESLLYYIDFIGIAKSFDK